MKKTLALLLILAISLTAVGCKSKPVDDAEVYVERADTEQAADAGEQQQTEPEQSDEQLPEQNAEQPDNTQQAEPTDNETIEENSVTQEQTEQTETEKGPTCTATLDDDFVDNEIGVVLTREESRKQKEYTAEDFPELDIEKIYYLYAYRPKTDGQAILCIVLSIHDKQKVLDGIRILEGYDIVYCAEPNYYASMLVQGDPMSTTNETVVQTSNYDMSVMPYYTTTESRSEYNANLSTLACCAKKYTIAGINKTTAIVKV